MQVFCTNCQLAFDAPEGTVGLVCPICRNPLHAEGASGDGAKPATKKLEWNGGTLSDLIALLSAPAVSACVEVIPLGADSPIGEVHLVAGGVSDSIYDGQATDDALDKLLLITPARFRVDPRLPHPTTGDLGKPGPEAGTLEGRPLAHLMRYCEDYVITCSIEVWRGNETARVDYRRGEISGVTVGGIDAPERLAEVMQWASGNYRLKVPAISLPAVAPRRATATVVPSVEGATAAHQPIQEGGPASRQDAIPVARQATGTKTIFGIPQSEIAAARAAAEAIMQAQGVGTPAPPEVAPPPEVETSPGPAPVIAPPGVGPAAVPVAASRGSATKTMFGVPAPTLPEGFTTEHVAPQAAAAAPVGETDQGRTDRIAKTGARKVAVPAPEIVPAAAVAAPVAPFKDVGRTTHYGYEARPSEAPQNAEPKQDKPDKPDKQDKQDRAKPVRSAPAPSKPETRQAPMWTYIGVGFTFGLALLGIYQLVGRLAH